MLDIKFVRDNPDAVKENIKKKFQDAKLPLVDEVIEKDAKYRECLKEVESLKAARNKLSKANGPLFGQLKKCTDEAQKAELQKQIDANNAAVKANADKMRQMHDKLVADIEELNARKATIKAKAAVAKTQSKVNEMTSAGDRAEGARSAFDRMEAKADEMLDRANAVAELSEKPADPTEDLAKKYAAAGAEAAVDDDLARLKKEMGLE